MFRRKPKQQVDVQWLIIGLGNPGAEYDGTRHNIGFTIIDELAKRHKIALNQSRFRSRYGSGIVRGEGVALVKPLTFMNLSGQAVAPLVKHFGLKPERILVIADETDLPLGRMRIRASGSAGGHNGHKSIIGSLGSQDYPRLRVGIGRVDRDETIDHVLGKFQGDERFVAKDMIERACDAIEKILDSGLDSAMGEFNAG